MSENLKKISDVYVRGYNDGLNQMKNKTNESGHDGCLACGSSQRAMYQRGYKAAFDKQQAIIDKQAKQLVALRGFAKHCINQYGITGANGTAKKFGLIDENGNHTPLLTGEE